MTTEDRIVLLFVLLSLLALWPITVGLRILNHALGLEHDS